MNRFAGVAVAVFVLAALPASAQTVPAFAVTPFFGIGTDGASPVSAALQVPITSALSIETDVAYRRQACESPGCAQISKLHAPSANVGVLYALPRLGRFTPYGAVGVGLARYGEAIASIPTPEAPFPVRTASRLGGTVNFGGGIKTQLTDRLDFRTDVRWFQNYGRQHDDQFRLAFGLGVNVGRR